MQIDLMVMGVAFKEAELFGPVITANFNRCLTKPRSKPSSI